MPALLRAAARLSNRRKALPKIYSPNTNKPRSIRFISPVAAPNFPSSPVCSPTFGRRVRRSAYTRSATAIGLTIRRTGPYLPRTRPLSPYFGVWREADHGHPYYFRRALPHRNAVARSLEPASRITREYSPVHNIGHFRFLECSHRTANGEPTGEVTLWDDIRFPFDPKLAELANLESERVLISAQASLQRIHESYECDSSGSISVTIENRTFGYSRIYSLGRWSQDEKPIPAVRRRKKPGQRAASSTA